MLEKCVLTVLELNWNQRLGHKKTKLNICHHMLTSSTQLQNRSFHVVERTRTSSKCQKMKYARAKRAKILFSIVKYANLWGFCCRRRRGCLRSLLKIDCRNAKLRFQMTFSLPSPSCLLKLPKLINFGEEYKLPNAAENVDKLRRAIFGFTLVILCGKLQDLSPKIALNSYKTITWLLLRRIIISFRNNFVLGDEI